MKNQESPSAETPAVSIEEALKMYLAIAAPQGLPEGIDTEMVIKRLKEMIALKRPEWDEKFGGGAEHKEQPVGYSQIKQQIVEEAQKEEIPTDPEERYLYERAKEARKNRLDKREQGKEEERKIKIVETFVETKQEEQQHEQKKAARLKEELRKKVLAQFQHARPHFSETKNKSKLSQLRHHASEKDLSLDEPGIESATIQHSPTKQPKEISWDPASSLIMKPYIRQRDLSDEMKDRLVALDTFHQMRRNNMFPKAEVVKPFKSEKKVKGKQERMMEFSVAKMNTKKQEPSSNESLKNNSSHSHQPREKTENNFSETSKISAVKKENLHVGETKANSFSETDKIIPKEKESSGVMEVPFSERMPVIPQKKVTERTAYSEEKPPQDKKISKREEEVVKPKSDSSKIIAKQQEFSVNNSASVVKKNLREKETPFELNRKKIQPAEPVKKYREKEKGLSLSDSNVKSKKSFSLSL